MSYTESKDILNQIKGVIDEYVEKYRKSTLPPIMRCEIYRLDSESTEMLAGESNPKKYVNWPDYWPSKGSPGIYCFFNKENLLYIGKASLQTLDNRVGSYFKYSEDKKRGVLKNIGSWTAEPTHIVMWTVPKEMFFEASALEEYLISKLKGHLPDNVIGK